MTPLEFQQDLRCAKKSTWDTTFLTTGSAVSIYKFSLLS